MTQPMNARERMESWWIETNGTGTDACSTCRPPHICAWHSARLNDLQKFIDEYAEARIKEVNILERIDRLTDKNGYGVTRWCGKMNTGQVAKERKENPTNE